MLKDRQELKFAALDCWKAAAEMMPENVTLDSYTFSDGQKVSLRGIAPADQSNELLNFNEAMRKATVNNQPLFDKAKGDQLQYGPAGPGNYSWGFGLELKRVEVQ